MGHSISNTKERYQYTYNRGEWAGYQGRLEKKDGWASAQSHLFF
jgi:hypothetical protein